MNIGSIQSTLSPDSRVIAQIDANVHRLLDNCPALSTDHQGRQWHVSFSGDCLEANLLLLSIFTLDGKDNALNTLKENIEQYMGEFSGSSSHNYTLYHGYMGLAYLNILAFAYTDDRLFLDNAITIAEKCVQSQFDKLDALRPGFNDGVAGCLYVFTLLSRYHNAEWITGYINELSKKLLSFCDISSAYFLNNATDARYSFEYGRSGIGWVFCQLGHEYENAGFTDIGNYILKTELNRFSPSEQALCLPASYLDYRFIHIPAVYDLPSLPLVGDDDNINGYSSILCALKGDKGANLSADQIQKYADKVAGRMASDSYAGNIRAQAVYLGLFNLTTNSLKADSSLEGKIAESVMGAAKNAVMETAADKWFRSARRLNNELELVDVEEAYSLPVNEVGDKLADLYEEMLKAVKADADNSINIKAHKANIGVTKYRCKRSLNDRARSSSMDYQMLIKRFIASPSPYIHSELRRNPEITVVSIGQKVDLATRFDIESFQAFWFDYGRYTCILIPTSEGEIEEYVPGVFKIIFDEFESPAMVNDVMDKVANFLLSQNEEIINGLMSFTESQDIHELESNLRFAIENGVYELIMEGILLVD